MLCDQQQKLRIFEKQKISIEPIDLLVEALDDLLQQSLLVLVLLLCEQILEEVFVSLLPGVESFE
ncbi:MAG: hypothetical protein WCH65_03840 [bacterium]